MKPKIGTTTNGSKDTGVVIMVGCAENSANIAKQARNAALFAKRKHSQCSR